MSIARRSSSRIGVGVRSFEPAFESAQRLPVDAGRGFDERPLHAGLHQALDGAYLPFDASALFAFASSTLFALAFAFQDQT